MSTPIEAAATLELRTVPHDAERYARALVGLLNRWCEDCALDVAKRMVTILSEPKPEAQKETTP